MKINNKHLGAGLTLIIILALVFLRSEFTSKEKNSEEVITHASTTPEIAATSPHLEPVKETPKTPTTKPIGSVDTTGFHSYANAEYNFTLQYPPYVKPRTNFFSFHEIGNNWRLYPAQINQGKAVASFSIFTIDQGPYSTGRQSYPLYFTAEVRVGVSQNVAECYAKDAGYTDQKVSTVTSNGITWKKFSTSDAGMMKYVEAESYRTIHNKMCYVLEQIRSGSSYRDEKMGQGIADTQLTNYYKTGETIIKTFKFTK